MNFNKVVDSIPTKLHSVDIRKISGDLKSALKIAINKHGNMIFPVQKCSSKEDDNQKWGCSLKLIDYVKPATHALWFDRELKNGSLTTGFVPLKKTRSGYEEVEIKEELREEIIRLFLEE